MNLYVSAGEPSGDAHAAAVVRALRHQVNERLRVDALGGERLAAAGAHLLDRTEDFSVLGFTEVLTSLPRHLNLLRRLRRRFRAGVYDLVLLVDYPGYHLRVAAAAKQAGVPVLYYIAPQLWAWRPGRAAQLKTVINRLAVILPFEKPYFAARGIAADFVGHPLMDRGTPPTRAAARTALGIPLNATVLAILPGSRPQEIARLWPPFRDTGKQLLAQGTCDHVVVACRPGLAYAGASSFLFDDRVSTVLAAADAALVKSGTSTLEAAVTDTPMVVGYRVGRVTGFLAQSMVQVPWISLVNLIADLPLVPEFTQAGVTPDRLSRALTPLLDYDSRETRVQRAGLAVVRERLGGPGAAGRVADIALTMMTR